MTAGNGAEQNVVASGHARADGSFGQAVADGETAPAATLEDLAGMVAVQVRTQTRRIAELELALADAEARLLSQARVICGAADAAGGDLFSRRPVREIIEDVLGAYPGISWEEIIGVGRERRLVEPRHRCMAAVYEERKDLSLPALGRIFHRDHTSVLHAVNRRGASR
ncbi:helix-turn-helix domain-containing protein [Ensifer adhaerens]|uniref:helix-turn-helix domain-containing protein n=1 Tax=Ensifer adhaerens TaxID=106592 RepID=UPI0023AA02BA|nr:helix-turn-helix domain-containing protein [Ensifer adhaerens]WDZ78786.1 helix-turn-helix domain-containing protein [Ensifer adhaerens]